MASTSGFAASADSVADAIRKWRRPEGFRRVLALAAIVLMLVGTTALVYATGGTRYAYLHVAYIPILLAALFFGFTGSILTAMAAALAVGPWMPLNVAEGISQPMASWAARGAFFVTFGVISGFVLWLFDQENKAIRRFAYRDLQTRLPNQVALQSELRRLIDREQRNGVLLILIELGRFDQLSATFGPHKVDTVLKQAVDRLRKVMLSNERLFRTGPFRLAVMSDAGTVDRSKALIDALQAPADCGGIPVDLEARAGTAWAPEHGRKADELIKSATAALYTSQSDGKSIAVFDASIGPEQVRTFGLLSDLREAIAANQLQLYYQPKIDLRTNLCVGAEALLRWPHKQHGFIPPDEFIRYAEQTRLMQELTHWVLNEALRQLALWRKAGLDVSVAVNISARDLEDDQFPAELSALLARHSVDAERLQVEVTETAVMADPTRSSRILDALKQIGVHVAIDDFGAGQSSLTYLVSLPADEIKIDRVYVANMEQPKYDRIVRYTIDLGHDLGLKVVAEGVETMSVYERLKGHSCDLVQGYFFAAPMPAADFELWLRENHRTFGVRAGQRATRQMFG